jgi:hypothetical protein
MIPLIRKANTGVRRSVATEFKKGQTPHNKNSITITCLCCGAKRDYAQNVLKKGKGKFCSPKCSYDYRYKRVV